MAANKIEATEIIGQLAQLYPKAFATDPSRVEPLVIGVKELLLNQCTLSPKSIANALRRYTGSTGYLKATVEGAVRIDLDGQAVGVVTMHESQYAERRLTNIAKMLATKPDNAPTQVDRSGSLATHYKIADKVATERTTATPSLSALQTGPRRLGLSDLKRAAAARRTVDASDGSLSGGID